MRRFSLGAKIIFAFALALLILFTLSIVAYRNILRLVDTSRWVAHTEEVLAALERVQSEAEDLEVERGYILTGDPMFLEPYHAAREAIRSSLRGLQQLTVDNPTYQSQLPALETLIAQRLAFAETMLDARETRGAEAALQMVKAGQGKSVLTEIQALLGGLRSEEIALLQQRRIAADASAHTALCVILTTDGLAIVFVALSGLAIGRDLIRRKAAQRALIQAHTQLEQRVAERTATLSLLTADLQRSNEELQQFASVASHDLQEPLRTVASFVHLLAERYRGQLDAEADEYIEYIAEGTGRMQSMIQGLLMYARIGSHGLVLAPTESGAVVQGVLRDLHGAISASEAKVLCDHLPTVLADERQLTQLFQNLIGNALKYRGSEPPRIHISASRDGAYWVFSVRDNGIGIDPRHAERIFVIFQRLHTPKEYPGAGMGLAICKKIVERHGGRIWLESAPGKGSAFFFTLQDAQPYVSSAA